MISDRHHRIPIVVLIPAAVIVLIKTNDATTYESLMHKLLTRFSVHKITHATHLLPGNI